VKNNPQGQSDQKMINTLQGMNTKGCSEVHPCFPQAAPHYPWVKQGCGNNGLRKVFGVAKEGCATSCPHSA
jgi:hypothetical protein